MWHGPTLKGGVGPDDRRGEVDRSADGIQLRGLDRRDDGFLVVDARGPLEGVDRHLEDDEVQERLRPLLAGALGELVRELLAGLTKQR